MKCASCKTEISKRCTSGLCSDCRDQGYTLENVVPCCGDCNRVKGDILTHEETIAAIQAVLKVRKKNRLKLVVKATDQQA